jgi:hypothetical protein
VFEPQANRRATKVVQHAISACRNTPIVVFKRRQFRGHADPHAVGMSATLRVASQVVLFTNKSCTAQLHARFACGFRDSLHIKELRAKPRVTSCRFLRC